MDIFLAATGVNYVMQTVKQADCSVLPVEDWNIVLLERGVGQSMVCLSICNYTLNCESVRVIVAGRSGTLI